MVQFVPPKEEHGDPEFSVRLGHFNHLILLVRYPCRQWVAGSDPVVYRLLGMGEWRDATIADLRPPLLFQFKWSG